MNLLDHLPATSTRVERATDPELNEAVKRLTDAEVARLEDATDAEFGSRLTQLDEEWDVERALQLNASIAALLGLTLGQTLDRRFLLLPAAVFTFFAQHALQGWCPPLPIMRRLGIRTAREIERERYALKALRGDFDAIPPAGAVASTERVRAALRAVDR
jgi:hypothetical protein